MSAVPPIDPCPRRRDTAGSRTPSVMANTGAVVTSARVRVPTYPSAISPEGGAVQAVDFYLVTSSNQITLRSAS